MVTVSRTSHAVAYQAAHARTIKTDIRSLHAHWDEGRVYSMYGDRASDISFDVGISPSTVSAHMHLFRSFQTLKELDEASEKFQEYNYQQLVRLHAGKDRRVRNDVIGNGQVWECGDCGSRNIRIVEPHTEEVAA